MFPADFCELGVRGSSKTSTALQQFRADILGSLARAVAGRGDWRLVYPPSLRSLGAAQASSRLRSARRPLSLPPRPVDRSSAPRRGPRHRQRHPHSGARQVRRHRCAHHRRGSGRRGDVASTDRRRLSAGGALRQRAGANGKRRRWRNGSRPRRRGRGGHPEGRRRWIRWATGAGAAHNYRGFSR